MIKTFLRPIVVLRIVSSDDLQVAALDGMLDRQ